MLKFSRNNLGQISMNWSSGILICCRNNHLPAKTPICISRYWSIGWASTTAMEEEAVPLDQRGEINEIIHSGWSIVCFFRQYVWDSLILSAYTYVDLFVMEIISQSLKQFVKFSKILLTHKIYVYVTYTNKGTSLLLLF